MKQIELRMRIRNNLLVARRIELGMTQGQVAKEIGMAHISYNQFENFRASPIDKRSGDWSPRALKIADFYGVSPGDLWPATLRKIKQNSLIMVYADAHELTPGRERLALPPDRQLDYHELQDMIDRALSVLPERWKIILKMRLGLSPYSEKATLAEIAQFMGVSTERIRDLYNYSLYRIQQGPYSKYLRDWTLQEPFGIADEEYSDQTKEQKP